MLGTFCAMLPRCPALLFAASLLASASFAAEPGAPADPQLNPRGRAILSYFRQLQADPALKLVSGQFAGWSGSSANIEVLAKIHRATGQWPAMIGLDYCRWDQGEAAIDTAITNKFATDYWSAGGLVTISWHAPNPSKPNGGGLNEKGIKIADLLADGTPTHERWMKSLDHIAAGLQELQAAGVVVIWRPFHEMNGGWFWWGAQEPADLIAVWRHMFDYFTHTKQLHNLIWSYGPNQGSRTGAYYPGDGYADIIGLDLYNDNIDPAHLKGYTDIAKINKPYGLTEFGPHGASSPPGDYDYRLLLDGLAQNFPATRHFLCWDMKWNPAENKFASEFYNDPRVITRSRLPAGLAGK